MKRWLFPLVLSLKLVVGPASATERFHYENVLGTSLDLAVKGQDRAQAKTAVDAVLKQIAGFDQVLSNWKSDSQLSQLNRTKRLDKADAHLLSIVKSCIEWQKQSKSAFSCKLGKIRSEWQRAVTEQKMPDRVRMRFMARDANRAKIKLSEQSISLPEAVELDVNGLAKGYIIDQSLQLLKSLLPSATAIQINLGGDIASWSATDSTTWKINVANPVDTADNLSLLKLNIANGAIAASGHTSRGYKVERRQFSHILKPKDGWPNADALSAIVYAKDAMTADAIATALSNLPANRALDWVNKMPETEALLISKQGLQLTTDGWHKLVPEYQNNPLKQLLTVDYQIPTIDTTKYHRPYLSIWLSDEENRFVKQLILLGDTERWAKKNNRWWRGVGKRHESILETLARPTRRPGQYQLQWSGLNEFGQRFNKTKLWLHFEAAREGGDHSYHKLPVDLSKSSQQLSFKAKGELGDLTATIH